MKSRDETLISILARRAFFQPGEEAFTFRTGSGTEERITYAELYCRVAACAQLLDEAGAQGERVAILCSPGYGFITALLGCLCAGAVAVPAYPPQRHSAYERLRTIIRDADARFVLVDEKASGSLNKLFDAKDGHAPAVLAIENLAPLAQMQPLTRFPALADPAIIQYTSGSTGDAKGVVITHGNIMANSLAIQQKFGHSVSSKGVIWLPPHHDMGLVGGILQPVYTGFPCHLMPPSAFLDSPVRWLEAIASHKATISGGPTFAYERVVQTVSPETIAGLDLSSWRVAFVGAEWVSHGTLERFTRLCESAGFRPSAWLPCYGLAESTLLVAGRSCGEGFSTISASGRSLGGGKVQFTPEDNDAQTLIGCGAADDAHIAVVVDPERRDVCRDGEVGEVWVSGPSVAHGYWNRPEESSVVFGGELREHPGRRFLLTGDLGFVKSGELYITGRSKDILIIRGANYYSSPIEASARQSHPLAGGGAGVAFVTEGSAHAELVIVQEVQRKAGVDYQQVVKAIRLEIFREHGLALDAVTLVRAGSLPRTSSGKVQKFLVKEMYLAGTPAVLACWRAAQDSTQKRPGKLSLQAIAQDRDAIRERILVILCHVAGVSQADIDLDLPLHDQGIDSVKAAEFVTAVQAWLDVAIPETLLWEYPTINALADGLAKLSVTTSAVAWSPERPVSGVSR